MSGDPSDYRLRPERPGTYKFDSEEERETAMQAVKEKLGQGGFLVYDTPEGGLVDVLLGPSETQYVFEYSPCEGLSEETVDILEQTIDEAVGQ